MSETQEQLKETPGMVAVVEVVVVVVALISFSVFLSVSILALERRDSWEAEEEKCVL